MDIVVDLVVCIQALQDLQLVEPREWIHHSRLANGFREYLEKEIQVLPLNIINIHLQENQEQQRKLLPRVDQQKGTSKSIVDLLDLIYCLQLINIFFIYSLTH